MRDISERLFLRKKCADFGGCVARWGKIQPYREWGLLPQGVSKEGFDFMLSLSVVKGGYWNEKNCFYPPPPLRVSAFRSPHQKTLPQFFPHTDVERLIMARKQSFFQAPLLALPQTRLSILQPPYQTLFIMTSHA